MPNKNTRQDYLSRFVYSISETSVPKSITTSPLGPAVLLYPIPFYTSSFPFLDPCQIPSLFIITTSVHTNLTSSWCDKICLYGAKDAARTVSHNTTEPSALLFWRLRSREWGRLHHGEKMYTEEHSSTPCLPRRLCV